MPTDAPRSASSSFEAMFVRSLKVQGPLKEALLRAGFDADRLEPTYPMALWMECLEVARQHLHPDLPREEGLRRLGQRYWDGYRDTLVGRFVLSLVGVATLESVVKRIPKLYSVNRTQPAQMQVTRLAAPASWQLDVPDLHLEPTFLWGALETGLRLVSHQVRVECVSAQRGAAVLHIRG